MKSPTQRHSVQVFTYINTQGQDQQVENWTWPNIWNLLTTTDWLGFLLSVTPTIVRENFQIYSVQILEKCICTTFPPPCIIWSLAPM